MTGKERQAAGAGGSQRIEKRDAVRRENALNEGKATREGHGNSSECDIRYSNTAIT